MTKTKLDVKVLMLQRGVTQEMLAADLEVTREAISQVMRGKNRTPRIRNHISEKLGVPLGLLARALDWPDAPGRRSTAPEKVA